MSGSTRKSSPQWEFHVVNGAREILNSFRCRCAVREHQVTSRSHEERRAVGEMPTPSGRARLGDIVGDSTGVRFYILSTAEARAGVKHCDMLDKSLREPHATQRTTDRREADCQVRTTDFLPASIGFAHS